MFLKNRKAGHASVSGFLCFLRHDRRKSRFLHFEGESIVLDERGHLIVAERHAQGYAVASRRDANLIEQLSEIRIVFLRLIALVEESGLKQLAQRIGIIG